VDEPEFRVVDPMRRFLWWFTPPAAIAVVALVVLLAAGHVTGPLKHITVVRAMLASKREFFEDEQVKRILMANGYQVQITPVGSLELAEKPDLDTFGFVFPSGQNAADRVRERRRGQHAIAFRPFFTPIVLGTFREYAAALVKANVATQQGSTPYYDLDVKKLVSLIDGGALWSGYGLTNGNRIIAQSPDPCFTYSGAVYVGLVAFARYGHPPIRETEAAEMGRALKPMFDAEGQHGEDLAPKYLVPEGRSFAPVVVIYEHQFLAHQIRTLERDGRLDDQRVLLYPEAQHESAPELISLTPEGDEIGRLLMENSELRQRAVELGFHVLSAGGAPEIDFAGFLDRRGIPVPRTGVDNTEAWLPSDALFKKMVGEVGGCRW